jgi:hypothetical protein
MVGSGVGGTCFVSENQRTQSSRIVKGRQKSPAHLEEDPFLGAELIPLSANMSKTPIRKRCPIGTSSVSRIMTSARYWKGRHPLLI